METMGFELKDFTFTVGRYISRSFGKQVLVPDLKRAYFTSDFCIVFILKYVRN
jgi:hypothetical protein